MYRISFLITITCLFLLNSCGNTVNNELIKGKWNGAEWLVNESPSNRNIKSTSFEFDDKGNYSFTYGETVEKGTYKVENNMLFTTPAGEQEIMVYISHLTSDTLIFDMNRGGQKEKLTLVKEK